MAERLPRYLTVTPIEGAIITVAIPWAPIEAAVQAAGYEIVPHSPGVQFVPVTARLDCKLPGCIVAKPHTHQMLDQVVSSAAAPPAPASGLDVERLARALNELDDGDTLVCHGYRKGLR